MQIDLANHLLAGVPYIASQNCDNRPLDTEPELIVVHGISLPPGQYGGPQVEQLFTNRLTAEQCEQYQIAPDLRVSAHLFIRRDGEILQFVPFDRRAWHAGESDYQGRKNCNDFSIGIEVEGCDQQPYEAQQYRCLRRVVRALLDAYPTLSLSHIARHSDIAAGRKTDPGPYFNQHFMQADEA